jgi:hypothetical protein
VPSSAPWSRGSSTVRWSCWPAETAEERATLEQEMSALRRAVLAADIIVFAGIGYWLGMTIGG